MAITWTIKTAFTTGSIAGCAWNGSFFCITENDGIGKISTTTDGVTRTLKSIPTSTLLNGICWNGALFVVVGNSGVILTSPDGNTWTQRTNPDAGQSYDRIAWNGTKFCALRGDNLNYITSTDGITWSLSTFPASGVNFTYQVVAKTGLFVVLINGTHDMLTSPDAVTWTLRNVLAAVNQWAAVDYDGSNFLFTSNGYDNFCATSPDGLSGTQRSLPRTGYWSMAVRCSEGFFLYHTLNAGSVPRIYSSPTGVTWAELSINTAVINATTFTTSSSLYFSGSSPGKMLFFSAANTNILIGTVTVTGFWADTINCTETV